MATPATSDATGVRVLRGVARGGARGKVRGAERDGDDGFRGGGGESFAMGRRWGVRAVDPLGER